MYSVVKDFIDKISGDGTDEIQYTTDETHIAVAVLYYHVVTVDGLVRDEEIALYRQILADSFDINSENLLQFENAVKQHIKSESSLFPYTLIVRKLPLEKRKEILKNMQAISMADSEVHEFELNLQEHIAQLLGLNSTAD